MKFFPSSRATRTATAVALVCALGYVTGAAANYLGSGQHPSRFLRWTYFGATSGGGGSYITPATRAMNTWSNNTDLSLSRNSSNFDVGFVTNFYSGTGWAGLAQCFDNQGRNWLSDPGVFNRTLNFCYAYNDRFDMDSGSQSRRQNLFTHEAGHCWSLAHRNTTSSIMYPFVQSKTTLDSGDRSNINARY